MQRDPRAFLWDVQDAALSIRSFINGMDRDTYLGNAMVQAAVERKFEIIGEATVNPGTVWNIAQSAIPGLAATMQDLLDELGEL